MLKSVTIERNSLLFYDFFSLELLCLLSKNIVVYPLHFDMYSPYQKLVIIWKSLSSFEIITLYTERFINPPTANPPTTNQTNTDQLLTDSLTNRLPIYQPNRPDNHRPSPPDSISKT